MLAILALMMILHDKIKPERDWCVPSIPPVSQVPAKSGNAGFGRELKVQGLRPWTNYTAIRAAS